MGNPFWRESHPPGCRPLWVRAEPSIAANGAVLSARLHRFTSFLRSPFGSRSMAPHLPRAEEFPALRTPPPNVGPAPVAALAPADEFAGLGGSQHRIFRALRFSSRLRRRSSICRRAPISAARFHTDSQPSS